MDVVRRRHQIREGGYGTLRRRRGIAFVYTMVMTTAFFGFLILAVDLGRITLAKAELQTVADAAARYAATGMSSSSSKSATAFTHAAAVCAESRIDGSAPAVTSSNVVIGYWSSAAKTFFATNNEAFVNAVRVTVTRPVGSTDSVRSFASVLGFGAKTVRATSVATATETSTEITAPSQGNMWLAGMPDNTTITNLQGNATMYDNSGTPGNKKQRPEAVALSVLNAAAGAWVSFEGIAGSASYGGGSTGTTGPDGNLTRMVTVGDSWAAGTPSNSVNGIANVRAPLSACMAVFLTDSRPDLGPAPACLDFGTAAARDYSLLEPALKQPFFIGDGKTSSGEVQRIKVPAGATRVYLGMMDAWQWNDNSGSFETKFYGGTKIVTVK